MTYLVESSLRAEGDRLRITAKLIRVHDQMQIWSASHDSEPGSILALQRELSEFIAEQVRLRSRRNACVHLDFARRGMPKPTISIFGAAISGTSSRH